MQEQNTAVHPLKKAWQKFDKQNTKVKISLLTLLVAVITIPSLTAFVTNMNSNETDQGHAQMLAAEPRYYIVKSQPQIANPNKPSTVRIACNPDDLAVSGGLAQVLPLIYAGSAQVSAEPNNPAGSEFTNWYTVRSVVGGDEPTDTTGNDTTGTTFGNNVWTLTVLYTGSQQRQYIGKALCLRKPDIDVSPTCTPRPEVTCSNMGGVNCPVPTEPPGGWCSDVTPTPTPMRCGGNTVNPPTCPEGYACVLNKIPDTGGICKKSPGPTCTPEPPQCYPNSKLKIACPAAPPGGWCQGGGAIGGTNEGTGNATAGQSSSGNGQ